MHCLLHAEELHFFQLPLKYTDQLRAVISKLATGVEHRAQVTKGWLDTFSALHMVK